MVTIEMNKGMDRKGITRFERAIGVNKQRASFGSKIETKGLLEVLIILNRLHYRVYTKRIVYECSFVFAEANSVTARFTHSR
jgi:hypothetical protein